MADNLNPMPPSQSITDIREKRVTDVDSLQHLPDQNTRDGGANLNDAVRPGGKTGTL